MTIAIIGLILFFAAGAASVVAISLRHAQPVAATGPRARSRSPRMRPHPAPPVVTAPPAKRRKIRRTPADRNIECQIIRASLAVGVDANAVAAALRGSPIYNRRRVRAIADRMAKVA